jgi:hypothetical protein
MAVSRSKVEKVISSGYRTGCCRRTGAWQSGLLADERDRLVLHRRGHHRIDRVRCPPADLRADHRVLLPDPVRERGQPAPWRWRSRSRGLDAGDASRRLAEYGAGDVVPMSTAIADAMAAVTRFLSWSRRSGSWIRFVPRPRKQGNHP